MLVSSFSDRAVLVGIVFLNFKIGPFLTPQGSSSSQVEADSQAETCLQIQRRETKLYKQLQLSRHQKQLMAVRWRK
jgi:hypothetical protein